MEQFPLLFSHGNLVIKISVRLVEVVSQEIFLLSEVSNMKYIMSGNKFVNEYGWGGDCISGKCNF